MDTLSMISLMLAVAWVIAAFATWRAGSGRPTSLCLLVAAGHMVGAVQPSTTPLILVTWLIYGLTFPAGSLVSTGRKVLAAAGSLALVGWAGALAVAGTGPTPAALVTAALAITAVSGAAIASRCVHASTAQRRAIQWLAAAAVLVAASDAVFVALNVLVGAPSSLREWLLAPLVLIPLSQALAAAIRGTRTAEAVLVESIVVAGLAGLVVSVYLVVVVGLGRAPVGAERDVLLASIFAAIIVAALALPVRHRLVGFGTGLIARQEASAEEVVATFGARMTRAVPMDELMLQLAESLRATVATAGAEVWVGTDGVLTRTVSVPNRPAQRLELGAHERVVVGRARIGGPSWSSVWLPQLVHEPVVHEPARAQQRDGASSSSDMRVAPAAHLGELLGLIVVRRSAEDSPFSADDERLLVDLARQLGLALHNVRLDSALQKSLDELQQRNAELQASRLRIVTASDDSRRAIERNLHDGAQQHLVALAVKLGLARQIAEEDPELVLRMLEELRIDVQTTIRELRELAHGIYPPLLRDRGLGEALRTAAARSPLPCSVVVDLPGRYPEEAETAAYFCCLEALQNAGKYAGAAAEVTVGVGRDGPTLWFRVTDDGVGFAGGGAEGHGFVNMRDRLGAIGGELSITAEPGHGTTVEGRIPAQPLAVRPAQTVTAAASTAPPKAPPPTPPAPISMPSVPSTTQDEIVSP